MEQVQTVCSAIRHDRHHTEPGCSSRTGTLLWDMLIVQSLQLFKLGWYCIQPDSKEPSLKGHAVVGSNPQTMVIMSIQAIY